MTNKETRGRMVITWSLVSSPKK